MIEEGKEQLPDQSATTTSSATSGDMAEALDAMKASSPSLGAAIEAAGITPNELAGSHDRATSDEHGTAEPTPDEGSERG